MDVFTERTVEVVMTVTRYVNGCTRLQSGVGRVGLFRGQAVDLGRLHQERDCAVRTPATDLLGHLIGIRTEVLADALKRQFVIVNGGEECSCISHGEYRVVVQVNAPFRGRWASRRTPRPQRRSSSA